MANQQPETAATHHDFYLEEIEIENFRCFEHLKVALHPRMNVFVGANASGKTAIFDAIVKGISLVPDQITNTYKGSNQNRKNNSSTLENLLTENDKKIISLRRNVEIMDSLSIFFLFKSLDKNFRKDINLNISKDKIGEYKWKINRTKEKKNISLFSINKEPEYTILSNLIEKNSSNSNFIFPIFIAYDTLRLIKDNLNESIPIKGSRLNAYTNWKESVLATTIIFNQWAGEHDYNMYQAERLGVSPQEASPEFIVVREAIKASVPGCKEIYFNVRDKEVHYAFEDGRDFPFSYWSDGVRNLIRLVGDIALRCAILNPDMGIQANETPGIVLIDEVDLHLHPGWQRQVLPGLKRAFPNIQFIVTTHSPQVLSSVPGECVFVLENFDIKKNSDGTVFHPFTQERDSNAILQDAFGVPVLEPQAEAELHAIYQHITDGDAEGARALLDKLILKRGEADLEVQRMNTYLELL